MNDLERKVTEFLKGDAADAQGPAQLPQGMAKRIRRRQTRTAMITGAVAVAIIAVTVTAFRTLMPLASDRETPAGPGFGTAGSRVASLPLAQIEVPDGWWLTDMSRGLTPYSREVFELTNYEPDLGYGFGWVRSCGGWGYQVPAGGARLTLTTGEGIEAFKKESTQPSWPNTW